MKNTIWLVSRVHYALSSTTPQYNAVRIVNGLAEESSEPATFSRVECEKRVLRLNNEEQLKRVAANVKA